MDAGLRALSQTRSPDLQVKQEGNPILHHMHLPGRANRRFSGTEGTFVMRIPALLPGAGHNGPDLVSRGPYQADHEKLPRKAGRGFRYCDPMRKATMIGSAMPGRAVKLAGALAVGGATTVLTSWAVGKLMQKDLIIRPSREVYEHVRARRSPQLARRLEQTITGMGDYPVLVPFSVLVGGLVAYERRDWVPVPLLASGLAAEIYLQKLLKTLVKGSKPAEEHSVGPPGDFPSGGAARTVITFGLLAHLLAEHWNSPAERWAVWSIVLTVIAAQGGSRLYLGRHWPEDILGGWLFGWLILRSLIRLAELTRPGELGQPAG
jgi:hypothetical protein